MTIEQTETKRKGQRAKGRAANDVPPVLATEQAAAAAPDVRLLKIGKIAFSSLNVPHRDPDPGLVASVRDNGVIEPLMVRPIAPAMVTDAGGAQREVDHELVIGERRLKAGFLAGLDEVLVEVRELTDAQALELQTEENLHRLDLSPMQEAVLFQAHRVRLGRTTEEIAARAHTTRKRVEQRLVLLDLPADGQAALEAGRILLGTAIEIASLTEPKDRTEALTLVTPADTAPAFPLSVARGVIAQRFHLRMVGATFPVDDAQLVAAAGSCTTCAKRTSNQLVLSIDGLADVDRCTDRVCWEAKCEAAWSRRRGEAEAKGLRVYDVRAEGKEGEAARLLVAHPEKRALLHLDAPCEIAVEDPRIADAEDALAEAEDSGDAAGVEAAQARLTELQELDGRRTWRDVVGAAVQPAALVRAVEGGREQVVELADERAALQAVKDAGHELPGWAEGRLAELADAKPPPARAPVGPAAPAAWEIDDRAGRLLTAQLVEILVPAAEKVAARPGRAVWRGMVAGLVAALDYDAWSAAAERRQWLAGKGEMRAEAFVRHTEVLSEKQLMGLAFELLANACPKAAAALAAGFEVDAKKMETACRKVAVKQLEAEQAERRKPKSATTGRKARKPVGAAA